MKIDFAISPCPNDTFTFYHLMHTGVKGHPISAIFADVEELNRRAIEEQCHIITKLSYAVIPQVEKHYDLLSFGSALGYNCGPILVSYEKLNIDQALSKIKRIAIPGKWTTANALLHLFLKEKEIETEKIEFVPIRYNEIISSLQNGDLDFGVIIHEERIHFEKQGINAIQDLGLWWETTTKLPIPLGCIALRKDYSKEFRAGIESGIQKSLLAARQNPISVWPFVKNHAQSLDPDLIQAHIALYVNKFTMELGKEGRQAIAEFFKRLSSL